MLAQYGRRYSDSAIFKALNEDEQDSSYPTRVQIRELTRRLLSELKGEKNVRPR